MAKLLVQHDTDPGICVILAERESTVTEGLLIWVGECTQCGSPIRGTAVTSVERARAHVDEHEDAR
jgi:hypothetical protein